MKTTKILIAFLAISFTTAFSSYKYDGESNYVERLSIKNKNSLITDQHGEFWCWAAVAESVNKYFGKDIPQVDIIKAFFAVTDILPQYYLSNQLGLPSSHNDYYKENFLTNDIIKNKAVSLDSVESHIKKGNPVVAFYSSHASVIVGYRKNEYNQIEYELMDPYYKKGNYSPFIWKKPDHLRVISGSISAQFYAIEKNEI